MSPKDPGRANAIVSVAATTTLWLGFVASATETSGVHRLVEWAPSTIRSGGRSMLELALMDVQSSAGTASPVEFSPWLAQVKDRLSELGRLPDNWGGSEKPSEHACSVALSLIQSMERHGHRVLHIAPIADGGLAISYAEDARSARFDVYNEGGIVVATREDHGAAVQYAELPEVDAVAALSGFLQHHDDATSAG